MAITTLAGLKAGTRQALVHNTAAVTSQRLQSSWAISKGSGAPVGTYSASIDGVTHDSSSVGAIPFQNPSSGSTYVVSMASECGATRGMTVLCDRLWSNGNIDETVLTAQSTVSFPTLPARDINNSTDGVGVLACLEVSATMGAGTPYITLSYTNSSGTAGRACTTLDVTVTASQLHSVYDFGLQAGDVGVRSIQSLTFSATWTSGTCHLVLYRPLFYVPHANYQTGMKDAISLGLLTIPDSPCLYYIGRGISGSVTFPYQVTLYLSQG